MDSPHFDVFLSHNSRDKPAVERLAVKLQGAGLAPWLDKWCLTPGGRWQEELVGGLRACAACAVFVGASGLGDWVHEELGIALDRAAKDRSFRLFLVLLPGLPEPFDATTLPPFLSTRTWVDLRPGIEEGRAFQHLVSAIKGVPFGPQLPAEANTDVCPYRGLQAFDEEHAELFHGRENDVQRLVEKLKATHFLAVLGPSGSGKSSLVRAGLVPALRNGVLPGSHAWSPCIFTPGAHPLSTLVAQLLRLYGQGTMQRTLDEMGADARTLHLAVTLALADHAAGERVVWVIDQFEEVFTLCQDEQERAQFLANLLYAASVHDGRNVVLLTLRADFYPKCAAYPDLSARIAAQQFLVSPLDADGLRRAIEEPAWHVGLEFEEGLVATILADVISQPGALPLLEHALLELWERRRGHMLTLEAYRESGGVQGAIAKRADAIYGRFNAAEQAIARRTLLRLTQPGEGTEDTRRRAALGELVTRSGTASEVEAVVQALVDARLLTTSEDAPTHKHMVEVSHEALIRGWPQLRHWIDEDRSGLRVQRRLTEAAQEWQRLEREEGALYRGARLATALEWRAQHEAALNELEREFLDAGVALKRREEEHEQVRQQRELEAARRLAESERRRARVARVFSLGLVLVLVATLAAAVIALQQRGQAVDARHLAEQQRNQAQAAERRAQAEQRVADQQRNAARAARQVAFSRELAADAEAKLQTDPELSLLLAGTAVRTSGTTEATEALRDALAQSYVRMVMRGHTGPVLKAVFSPDGRYVATAGADKTARIWDTRTHKAVAVLRGHTASVYDVAFSPDGRYVVTASYDKSARVWDARSGRLVAVLHGHTGPLVAASFSPNGHVVVTASRDDTARLWDALTGRLIAVLRGHTGPLTGAAFSPDGLYVATASADKTGRLWDTGSGRLTATLKGHTGVVNDIAFSADGKDVVTASDDGTARVWSVPSGRLLATLRGSDGLVYTATFSPDGQYVLTAYRDGTARLFNARTGAAVTDMSDQTSPIDSAVFSHDGRIIVTAGADGSVRLWTLDGWEQAVLLGHTGAVNSVAFSPDDGSVLTAGADGTARLWDAGEGRILASGTGTARVWRAAYSPLGDKVVTANGDGTTRVWEARTGRALAVLRGQPGVEDTAVFSPDGKEIATASNRGSTWIWDTGTWQRKAILCCQGVDYDAEFSPDGRYVVTAGAGGTARVWDAHSGHSVATLRAYAGTAPVDSARFSPDGRYVVLTSDPANVGGTAQVWDARTWKLVAVLQGHSGYVWDAVFSPDGRYIVTASTDSTARVWDTRTWRTVATLQGHTDYVTSAAFSPDGKWVVTGSHDETARVWEVGTWRTVATLFGGGEVNSVAFSPDGKTVLLASQDGTARVDHCDVCGSVHDLLALAGTRVTRSLTPAERKLYLHES